MTINLQRPLGLENDTWAAVEEHIGRLQRAEGAGDRALVIGSAKDLVETIAKIVLDSHGETVPSNADLPSTLTKAHAALGRLPGQGPASTPPIQNIAQGAKTIVAQLPELRNRLGTGHGRVLSPELDDEISGIYLDAALLWSRWALRRLERALAGRPLSLINDLQSGIFYRDDLTRRLQALNLATLDTADQRLVGVAVAHRAMQGTFNVHIDGIQACAQNPDLAVWPPAYRAGVVEGLFLDREGYVDIKRWAPPEAATIVAVHPDVQAVVTELAAKINEASWSHRFATDADERAQVVQAMREAALILPRAAQSAWTDMIDRLQPPPF